MSLPYKVRLSADENGDTIFLLDVKMPDGKRARTRFHTRAEAKRAVELIEEQIKIGGTHFAAMSTRERVSLFMVIAEAKEYDLTVGDLLTFYKTHKASMVAGKVVTLKRLVEETIASAIFKNNRPSYVDSLKYFLGKFIQGREELPLSSLTLGDIEGWLANQKGYKGKAAPSTLMGLRNRLSTMFAEAVRRKYISRDENPMASVLTPIVHTGKPQFLFPSKAEELLWVCRATDPEFLPYVVIGMFAGIRPEELEKLKWSDIDFPFKRIAIDDVVSKVRMRRYVDIEPVLMEWLLFCKPEAKTEYILPVDAERRKPDMKPYEIQQSYRRIRQYVKRHRSRLSKRSGVKWEADFLRKTAATYMMVAKGEDAVKVSAQLGNSPKILYDHYRGLAKPEDSQVFWALTPSKVKNDPIELPKGGTGKKKPGKLIP